MKRYIVFIVLLAALAVGIYKGQQLYGSDNQAKDFISQLLLKADIKIDGTRPWDIVVHNPKLYQRVLQEGSLGLGEAYMDGWWDCPHLDQFFYKLFQARLDESIGKNWSEIFDALLIRLFNHQTKELSKKVGEQHYDISNEFFKKMLDSHMIYSCGYWRNAQNLDQAQEHKLDLICRKLGLKKGMTLLDIGCGWGGLALYAAKHYGATVTGLTISKEQYDFAQSQKGSLPVTFLLQDYRDCQGTFDRIASIGMFEHVGAKNYDTFMQVVERCLHPDGLALLHTIGANSTPSAPDAWISKYIFPNSILPSLPQITKSLEGLFIIEDLHNFGASYDKTLMAWYNNFEKAWPEFKKDYGESFYRMWRYYLLSCAGLFRARGIQLWQLVLSKNGVQGGYESVR